MSEPREPGQLSRRTLLGAAGASAVLAPTLSRVDAVTADRRLRLSSGTNFAACVSPDGQKIAIDLLGVLWVLPASGGPARRLTGDRFDITQPSWSPDSSSLVFQSYREGVFDLWTVRADGGRLRRLTEGPYDHREPRWSPHGRSIVFSADSSGGSYGIYSYDLRSTRIATLVNGSAEEYEPAVSPDGTKVAFVVGSLPTSGGVAVGTAIDVLDLATGRRSTEITAPAEGVIRQPAWTPDGRQLTYHLFVDGRSDLMLGEEPLVDDEEVYPFQASWLGSRVVYTGAGGIRSRRPGRRVQPIGFAAAVSTRNARYHKRRRHFEAGGPQRVKGIGSPVLSPDGDRVAFRALNDIYMMRIGHRPQPLTRDHWWKSDPTWSPDGTQLAYSTDRGGTLNLWIRDLSDGSDRQLTDLAEVAAVSGSWSPDGREIAFLDQDGNLWAVEVSTGDVQRVFPATFEPGRPTWSADGRVIALAAVRPYSGRFREGLSTILLIDRRTGAARYVEPLPRRSIQTRGDDGPVWSPDGTRMVFAVASVLYVLDVKADGTPVGQARQVTDEVSDAPSWSGDSRTILYLSNGRLRTVAADGGTPRTVAMPLHWTNIRPRGRTIIHAGRMWDGVRDQVRTDVDIVVEGQRIVEIGPHRPGRDGELVDASGSFVMPGLIDMHHHREMQGYSYGDRQGRLWLSLGITTTRSPGSPAYQMVEERESTQSGARIAPRYFATGEAVDGPRIYYNFMRPTFDGAQLRLELSRARALDYDLMKSYVRLPVAWQQWVTHFAHSRGIPATGHYHYPAMAFGGDGMEHTGATSRFGFSRTVTLLGNGYDDVIDMFNATTMARTPTLFGSTTLYREDRSLVEDARVRALYPPWRLAALAETVEAAQGDQAANRANLRAQVHQALAMVQGGGTVITGTDSPIDHAAISTHMNLRAMVKYGFTPYEALITATSAAGDYLGDHLGRIRQGAYADIAIVRGDPLADIRAAADVEQVLLAGVRHTIKDLVEPFNQDARTASTNRVLDPVPDHPSTAAFWWHDPAYVAHGRHACCSD